MDTRGLVKRFRLPALELKVTAAMTAAIGLTMWKLPGAPPMETLLLMLGALAVTLAVDRLNRFRTTTGTVTLIVLWGVMSCIIVANTYIYTTRFGFTLDNPMLFNRDSIRWFFLPKLWIEGKYDNTIFLPTLYYFITIMRVFGINVVPLMVANMLCGLLSVSLTGHIAGKTATLCDNTPNHARRISAVAMVMMSGVSFFIAISTSILKDAPMVLGITMAIAGMTTLADSSPTRRSTIAHLALIAGGTVIACSMRTACAPCIIVIALIFGLRRSRRSLALMAVAIAVSGTAGALIMERHSESQKTTAVSKVVAAESLREKYATSDEDHSAYTEGYGKAYFNAPLWKKIAMLPGACALQYFIPLMWTASRDLDMGFSFYYAHFGVPWYIIGGIFLYFMLFRLKGSTQAMTRLALAGAALWVMPAYATSGTISRYALPALPAIATVASAAWVTYRKCRSFRVFMGVYALTVVASLISIYHIQYP